MLISLALGTSIGQSYKGTVLPLELPMSLADNVVLDMIEGEVLGTRMIEELLALVDRGEADNTAHLTADRNRLQREISNLMELVAAGTPASTVAPKIHEREKELARVEAQLGSPKRPRPNVERLREALTLRAEQWRATLRAEPKVARLLLWRLVEPLTLHDESERPEWLKAETEVKPALLEESWPAAIHEVASLTSASWNQIASWLNRIEALRQTT